MTEKKICCSSDAEALPKDTHAAFFEHEDTDASAEKVKRQKYGIQVFVAKKQSPKRTKKRHRDFFVRHTEKIVLARTPHALERRKHLQAPF